MIKSNRYYILMFVMACLTMLVSCNGDENEREEKITEGFSEGVKTIVSKEKMTELKELGFTLHEGKVPPNVEGVYLASPYYLSNSSVVDDSFDGIRIEDYKYRIRDQDTVRLTVRVDAQGIDYETQEIIYQSPGELRYLSGKDNSFNAFAIVEGYVKFHNGQDSARYKSLEIISGRITASGIRDYQYSFTMLDNYGDPHGKLLKNNKSRVFYDQDGLAENSTMVEETEECETCLVRAKNNGRFLPMLR